MAEKEEPIVQVEILYGGGREGLNVVRDYVNSRIPVQVMPVSGDLTGRRTGDFLLVSNSRKIRLDFIQASHSRGLF